MDQRSVQELCDFLLEKGVDEATVEVLRGSFE